MDASSEPLPQKDRILKGPGGIGIVSRIAFIQLPFVPEDLIGVAIVS